MNYIQVLKNDYKNGLFERNILLNVSKTVYNRNQFSLINLGRNIKRKC